MGMFPQTKEKVEKIYYKNEEEIDYICDFFQNNQHTEVKIDLFDTVNTITYYEGDGQNGYDKENVEIIDGKLLEALETLKNDGFIRIVEEYDYIFFQTWGSFGGSVGLMFSFSEEPNLSQINAIEKVVEKLHKKNWFYCKIKYE